MSDNLSSARFILVVEWIEDETALKLLLPYYSHDIKKSLNNKTLAIDFLGGASKLSYKLSLYKSQLCKYHTILDSDQSWRDAFDKAKNDWLLDVVNTTMVNSKGKIESEFEDLLNPDLYRDLLLTKFWVNIDCDDFNKSNKKWSNRISNTFTNQWKPYNQEIENEIKSIVAKSIKWHEDIAILQYNSWIMDSLVKSIEDMILT